MIPSTRCKAGTHPQRQSVARQVRALDQPENYYVGMPDNRFPALRNILLFCSKGLPDPSVCAAHHRHMLIVNLESSVSLLLDSRMLTFSPGQSLLVFPFQSHRYLRQKTPASTFLFITFEWPETDVLDSMRNSPASIPPGAWPVLDELLKEYRAAAPREPADAVSALLTLLLVRLVRQSRREPAANVDRLPALPTHRLVQRACRLVETRLDKPLSVQQLAEDLHVSSGYLRACFSRVLGLRVSDYIRRTRLYRACSLLDRAESNMTQIAEQCGFASLYAFSRAFKCEIGMAPTRYRAHLWQTRNRT